MFQDAMLVGEQVTFVASAETETHLECSPVKKAELKQQTATTEEYLDEASDHVLLQLAGK